MVLEEQKHKRDMRARPARSRKNLRWAGLAALAIAILIAVTGIWRRQQQDQQVTQWTRAEAVPTVTLITPQRGVSGIQEVLPGTIQAWYEAPIYARVNGYLKNWYFDYGARVKKGQLLAVIDAPDLDQQFHQARADLAAAAANERLAALTAKRWQALIKSDSVSRQETDEKVGALEARQADVGAAKANVQRLQALENFKRIVVPFDGIVTARETDIGALINAGSGVGGGSGPELFRVADVHEMRIYVQVPQQISAGLREGLTAELHLPQYPDRTFQAIVATTARAISTTARTLLVELHADNPDGVLQPGTYAEVRFDLPNDPDMVRIPTSALLFREHGMKVAVLGPGDKVVLKPVKLGRNLGTEVEVLSGLTPADHVINTPPDSLAAGDLVHVNGAPVKQVAAERSDDKSRKVDP